MTAAVEPVTEQELAEARCRRLMAERARLSLTWQTRHDRARLLGLVEDALDEWLAARG